MNKKTIFFLFAFSSLYLCGLKIDRVILASDTNPLYLPFWPLVARAWKERIGIQPTLALIAEDDIAIDTSIGDVIRFKPIPGIKTSMQAQVMRLLLPIYFPDQVCIISDIDMLPISKEYFINSVADIPDDKFVVYRDHGYGTNSLRFPMCYNAGKGYLFQSIFKINTVEDIPQKIKEWAALNCGWETDEVMLYKHVRGWEHFNDKCVLLHHTSMVPQRIDRADWKYSKNKLKEGYYVDSHMVRPLDKFYKEIKELTDDLGLNW